MSRMKKNANTLFNCIGRLKRLRHTVKLKSMAWPMFALCLFIDTRSFASAFTAFSDIMEQYKTLQANFVQKQYDAQGKLLSTVNGKLLLQRPGYLRWETFQPSQQILIIDPTHIWLYDVDLEQVTVKKLKADLQSTPAALLSAASSQLKKTFTVQTIPAKSPMQVFAVSPKSSHNDYEKLYFYFNGINLMKMAIFDPSGQKLWIQFSQLKLNQNLPKNSFREKIPKSVDVIEE